MDYTGCCNERLRARFGKAAPAVHALAIVAGHAIALGLLVVPMIVPMLFKAWTGHDDSSIRPAMASTHRQHAAGTTKATR